MIKIHPEVVDVCDTLQTLVSKYVQEFSEIENWFEIEDAELLDLHQSEINKWLREAALYKEELKTQRDNILRLGKNQISGARSNESMYALNDKSYAKRKNSGKLVLADSYEYPYADNSNPLEQLNYINDRLRELISIYSSKTPPYIFREFMSRKGTKRHQAYAEMEFLMNRAEVLVGLLDRSARSVDSLHHEIDTNAEGYISCIRNEYCVNANRLDLEYVERVRVARQNFEQNLQLMLPVEDLEEIDNKALACSLASDLYKPLSHMPKDIYIGSFEFEVRVDKDYEYVTGVLASLYGSYVRETIFVLPLLLQAETNHLFFINNKDQEGITIESIKGFICRYLLNMPVAGVNCYFIDGYHSGANFNLYSPLNDVDKNIVRNEVATSSQSINKLLDTILKSNENIIGKKLIGYDDLFSFNRAAGNVYERYSLLVIDNFPKGFNDESFDKLERILIKSEQCGVSVVINYNENLYSDEYGDIVKRIALIKQHMCCLLHSSDMLFPEEDVPYTLHFGKTPDNWNELLRLYSKSVVTNSTKSEPLRNLLADDSEMFSRNSCKNLIIPFGVGGPGKIQNLTFGEGVSHSGILVGTTGSGKSTLLNSIILSAIAHYGPDELSLYLLDFKEGMEFSLYSNNQVPQVKFVSIESQQELGLSVLGRLCDEIADRSDKFKVAKAKDIEAYRENTGNPMPRILVIIDEFHALFDINTNYKIAEKCADHMKTLIKQGRSFGVNVLIASQGIARLHYISLDAGLYAQMAVRIALKCDSEDAEFMFRINPKVTEKFGSTKGAGAYIADDSCTPEEFVTAFMPDNDRIEFLQSVAKYYAAQGIIPDTVVYDGSKSVYFNDLISNTNELEGIIGYDEDYQIVLGESMGEVEPVTLQFDAKNKNNLLFVSKDQDLARKMFANFIQCLLIAKDRDSEFKSVSPFIFLCDFKIQTRKGKRDDILSQLYTGVDDVFYTKSDKGIVDSLTTLYDEYKQREEDSDGINQPLFLMLFGLQNISKILDTFDGDEEDFEVDEEADLFASVSEEKLSAGQMFRILLQKGAGRNIFIITWMDSSQSVKKLEFGDSEYFGNVLISKMSSDDSDALIGVSLGSSISNTQVAFRDIDSETQKLKIYQ